MIIFGKALTAVALTVTAVTLMVVSTTSHNSALARWAILTAMFGCTLVVTIVIDAVVRHSIADAIAGERKLTAEIVGRSIADERKRTEDIVAQVAAQFAEREVDRRLRSVTHGDDL